MDKSRNVKHSAKKKSLKTPRKKIRFCVNDYKSENVFKQTSFKLTQREATPFKRDLKRQQIVIGSSESTNSAEGSPGRVIETSTPVPDPDFTPLRKRKCKTKSKRLTLDKPKGFDFYNFYKSHSVTDEEDSNESAADDYDFLNNSLRLHSNISTHTASITDDTFNCDDDDDDDESNQSKNSTDEPVSIEETVVCHSESDSSNNSQDESCITFHSLPNHHKLVIIKNNSRVNVHGLMSIKVLHGTLELFGHRLTPQSMEQHFYSPRGTALLNLNNVTNSKNNSTNLLANFVPELAQYASLNTLEISDNSLVVDCSKLTDVKMQFMEKHISQQLFPKFDNENRLQVEFQPGGLWNVIDINRGWIDLLENVTTSTKLLLAGGKGVGKSTFLRYAINKLLMKHEKIRIIDLDPGQSEFSVPGCISVVTVSEALFGPNYTHLRKPDVSLLSDINVGNEPHLYLSAVEELMRHFETMTQLPTLVNTIGFTKGIGLNIVSASIVYVQPTNIVQIKSSTIKKNFKVPLLLDTVKQKAKMLMKKGAASSLCAYDLHTIESMSDGNKGWTLEPRQTREMAILAYFGGMMSATVQSLTSSEIPMVETSLAVIKLVDLWGRKISPAGANANLVALCSRENRSFRCYGWGVVRGIDYSSEKIVLMTPENPADLEAVDHLVVNNLSLPPSIYMTADEVSGNVPYVMEGELLSFGQLTKRSYVPANNHNK